MPHSNSGNSTTIVQLLRGWWAIGCAALLLAPNIAAGAGPNPTPVSHDGWIADFADAAWAGHPPSDTDCWARNETENFSIISTGLAPQDLDRIAQACENCRLGLLQHWLPTRSTNSWQPKCVLVVHRSPESYDTATGIANGASWGRALVTRRDGRIAARRIDLCATTPSRFRENLAHELTHVVLADCFPTAPVPRWLDEGAAVLAEPTEKRDRRLQSSAGDAAPLMFRAAEILAAEAYPAGAARLAFYVESQHLVRLLLNRGDAQRLLAFAKSAASGADDAALREHYGLDGLRELDSLRRAALLTAKNEAGFVIEASFRKRR